VDEQKPPASTARSPKRGWGQFLIIGLLTLLVSVAAWQWWRGDKASTLRPQTSAQLPDQPPGRAPGDPRLTFATPYRNVRPEVKYVGDQVCARCHAELVRTYRQHPMGRSLAPVSAAGPMGQDDAEQNADFRALGFHYRVERQGDRVVHREMKEDPQGRVLAEAAAEVRFVVGSGTRGRSYLIDHDGYLFQSPITWYPQKRKWDLSPGYATRHHHFARPVPVECLFCHSNRADDVRETVNRYRPPIFQGYTIGCERCHGPGELHARRHEQGEELTPVDTTIVNPRHLEPALRESVCEQCHLQGEVRVARRGRNAFDYRPGLPWHLFMSVFVSPANGAETKKFVGHVEQMHASRCFLASSGKMGCSTCHNPHQLPAAAERVAYYRDGCLTCHAEKRCSLPASIRLQKSRDDSCIDCHMPAGTSDIPHASITNHRIPRQVEDAPQPEPGVGASRSHETLLLHFHRDLVGANDPDVARDLGVALMDRIERYPDPVRKRLGQRALPLLDAALQTEDDDVPAWQARASALWALGRTQEATAALEVVLTKAPLHEAALHSAATLAMEMERPDAARGYWERAVRVNPWRYEFRDGLAAACAQLRDWRAAIEECQQTLQLNPFKWEVRKLLVRCYLAMGAKDRARTEFDLLLALQPSNSEALRLWYAERQD
jgi:tetratricopeptide (TPR) repeat protein